MCTVHQDLCSLLSAPDWLLCVCVVWAHNLIDEPGTGPIPWARNLVQTGFWAHPTHVQQQPALCRLLGAGMLFWAAGTAIAHMPLVPAGLAHNSTFKLLLNSLPAFSCCLSLSPTAMAPTAVTLMAFQLTACMHLLPTYTFAALSSLQLRLRPPWPGQGQGDC